MGDATIELVGILWPTDEGIDWPRRHDVVDATWVPDTGSWSFDFGGQTFFATPDFGAFAAREKGRA